MTAPLLKISRNILLVTVIAFTIFIGGVFMLHAVPLGVRDKIANGLLADFIITVPALYYFIIIRPFKFPLKSIFLVVSLCSVIAYLLLPAHQREYIMRVRKVSALVEVLFIVYAITKFNKLRRAYKTHRLQFADPIYNLRAAMFDVLGDALPVRVIASELAVLRYGLLCWKRERPELKDSISYTTHRESGYIAVWSILVVAVIVEMVALHLLLMKWNNTTAVIITILSVYGVIFLVADLSAIIKRKIVITGDQLLLRTGLRWRVITTLSNIRSIKKITTDHNSGSRYFKGGVIGSGCNVLITFKYNVHVEKLYGANKEVDAIFMSIDDSKGFAEALSKYISPN